MSKREIDLFVDHPKLVADKRRILKTVRSAIEALQPTFPEGDLSIAILSDAKVAEIHGDFLDDPSETDVITFPGDPEMEFAGEICVSADRALKTHEENSISFAEELTLYIMHGLLHLSGLNDKTDAQCVEMRKGERTLMELLHSKSEIPPFSIKD